MDYSIQHFKVFYKFFLQLNLLRIFSHTTIKHIFSIVLAALSDSYSGKVINFARYSSQHRTTIAHFLNHGTWDSLHFQQILKDSVVKTIYQEALSSGKPIFCIVDDTISSKTKPSSHALHPIEDAYFHQSHLKKKQDYGHQAIAVMLSCNGLVLNYDIILYNKFQSKIDLVRKVAEELPVAPVISYLLCDSWYTNDKIFNAFIQKGFYSISALKVNRIIYPYEKRMQVQEYASLFKKPGKHFHLVTVGNRDYYVSLYEGRLNSIENAIVLICYPKEHFGNKATLKAFLCTDVSLSLEEILSIYTERWSIEIFFRDTKGKLALDQYQIRSSQGIQRYWMLMSFVHFLCCTGTGKNVDFQTGRSILQREIHRKEIEFFLICGQKGMTTDEVLKLVG